MKSPCPLCHHDVGKGKKCGTVCARHDGVHITGYGRCGCDHSDPRPRYVEYRLRPDGTRGWCCYKDEPCETHARVFGQLVRIAHGEDSVVLG